MDLPTFDGEVRDYQALDPAGDDPRIYYINGIQTDAKGHAQTATGLSLLTEHIIHGVFNATAGKGTIPGFAGDLFQCLADWSDIFLSKSAEIAVGGLNRVLNGVTGYVRSKLGMTPADPINVAESIRRKIPEGKLVEFIEACVATYNLATASLFTELQENMDQEIYIVAHSQGNLITADALWSISIAYGEDALADMRVYSLASPAPAWPLGIRGRRKVYGHTNDLVTLADPHNWTFLTKNIAGGKYNRTAGDWRQYGASPTIGIEGHDLSRNAYDLNFAASIRRDLGLPPLSGENPKL